MQSRMIAGCFGIIAISWLPSLPDTATIITLLLLQYLLAIVFWRFKHSKIAVCLIYFSLGALYGLYTAHTILDQLLPHYYEGDSVVVHGIIYDLPKQSMRYEKRVQRFNVQIVEFDDRQIKSPLPSKQLKLTWIDGPELIPGQLWQLNVRLYRPRGLSNPGGFDYQRWHIQQGIDAKGAVIKGANNDLLADYRYRLDRYRWQYSNHIDQYLSDIKQSTIIKALLIGDKRNVPSDLWGVFSRTGTIHLMVISGLHIGIIAMIGYWLGRAVAFLLLPHYTVLMAAFSAVMFSLIYSAAAGFSLPTQRALIMLSILMFSFIGSRKIPVSYSFIAAMLLCLLFDPLAATNLSFYLSFTAVAALLIVSSGRRLMHPIIDFLRLQWAVCLGLAPVLLLVFNQMPLLATLVNMFAIPLFSLLLIPLVFIAGMLALFDHGLLSSFIFEWVGYALDQFINVLIIVDAKLSVYSQSSIPWYLWLLAVLGLLIILLPPGMVVRYMGLLLIAPALTYSPALLKHGEFDLRVLDVGQGLSVVITTSGRSLLFDTGSSWEGGSIAKSVIAPYLRHAGIDKIDTLVISHPDNDHAGGFVDLYDKQLIDKVFVGRQLKGNSVEQVHCDRQKWEWQGVEFEFLAVHRGGYASPLSANNISCILRISSDSGSVLIPGDIERPIEGLLVKKLGIKLKSDVVIAPHHGSLSSSSWPFIRMINPEAVIYSTGYNNRFKHPNERIKQRYKDLGVWQYNTAEHGAILIESRYDQPLVIKYDRAIKSHYWQ